MPYRAVWLGQASSYLRGADPALARLIDATPYFDPRAWQTRLPPMDLLGALLFQVIGLVGMLDTQTSAVR